MTSSALAVVLLLRAKAEHKGSPYALFAENILWP